MIKKQFINSFALDREKVSSFKRYPFDLPVVKKLDEIDHHKPKNYADSKFMLKP